MLVNLSDYLTHLVPAKYFDFVIESKLLKTSDFVTCLALVTHCLFQSAFVNDSEFVSASLLPLSFDFAMKWTFLKLSMPVTSSGSMSYFAFARHLKFEML